MRAGMRRNGLKKWNINMSSTISIQKNTLYPVFLKLEQMHLLLVGAGNVGLEKLQSILGNSPASRVTIIAPMVRQEVREYVSEFDHCDIIEKPFEESDLEGKDLVVVATDDKALNEVIRDLAHERKIWVNVADTPALCDFYLGSIVQKGNLKIAISTNGKSPTTANELRNY